MRLHYFKDPAGNFGDDLNEWIWDDLLPGWREVWPEVSLVGVGTLINVTLPPGPKLIIGSGVGYGPLPSAEAVAESRILAVRGPKSAAALGLPPEAAVVDAAVLLPRLPRFADVPKTGDLLLVPHHESVHFHQWQYAADRIGARYVSPQIDAVSMVKALAGARMVLVESMHAAIIADAFGVPWRGFSVNPLFNTWKWEDWGNSIGITPVITPLRMMTQGFAPLLTPLRRRRRKAAAVAGDGSHSSTRMKLDAHANSLSSRVRQWLDRQSLAEELAVLAAMPGQLSDRAQLGAAQDRLAARLADLRAEIQSARQG
jgi:succinoglycan biosynthesis protein ExoV